MTNKKQNEFLFFVTLNLFQGLQNDRIERKRIAYWCLAQIGNEKKKEAMAVIIFGDTCFRV